MAIDAVTPQALLTSVIAVGGTPIQIAPGDIAGGFVMNPASEVDQDIPTAEVLYITSVGTTPGDAPGDGNGTTFALYPGQTYEMIPGQTTQTWVNAATTGHKFSGIYYLAV